MADCWQTELRTDATASFVDDRTREESGYQAKMGSGCSIKWLQIKVEGKDYLMDHNFDPSLHYLLDRPKTEHCNYTTAVGVLSLRISNSRLFSEHNSYSKKAG